MIVQNDRADKMIVRNDRAPEKKFIKTNKRCIPSRISLREAIREILPIGLSEILLEWGCKRYEKHF